MPRQVRDEPAVPSCTKDGRPEPCSCFFRKLRGRPSEFAFAFADSIRCVDPELWDSLAGRESFFLSRPFLAALEAAGPEGLEHRYAIAFRDERPVAAVALQLAEMRASQLTRACEGGAIGRIRARLLICGNLLSWGRHGIAFAPGEDPAALWPAVLEAIERVRRTERFSEKSDVVLVKDLPASGADAAPVLGPAGYARHETEPDMVLDLPARWRGHEDYLGSLNAKYRKAARATLRATDEAGYSLERLDDLAPHAARLHELYLAVHDEATVRPVLLPPSYLPAVARAAGDGFRAYALVRDGSTDGFATVLADGETAVGYTLGFDREANARAPLYLRLLQAVVAGAIELGCRRLSLGRTSLEPKARLGARPEPLSIWVRHKNPVLHWILSALLCATSHEEPPDRSPFKQGREEQKVVADG